MFVKKDLRKIPTIFSDAQERTVECPDETKDKLTELRLSRRQAEFNGSISILCNPSYAPTLQHLVSLSLYDCQISSLDNIGSLNINNANTLQELNIGRNPLTHLPQELAVFEHSLLRLWCDDCDITGPIPDCVLKLRMLQELRMSNNAITVIPDSIENLTDLKLLVLDRNQIDRVPSQIKNMSALESLSLRSNRLGELPQGVPGRTNVNLKLLHISSNGSQLTSLPESIVECTSLESIYANGNQIHAIPVGFATRLTNLKHVNLSHNDLNSKDGLPQDFLERFGEVDTETGECTKDTSCKVILSKNPIVQTEKE